MAEAHNTVLQNGGSKQKIKIWEPLTWVHGTCKLSRGMIQEEGVNIGMLWGPFSSHPRFQFPLFSPTFHHNGSGIHALPIHLCGCSQKMRISEGRVDSIRWCCKEVRNNSEGTRWVQCQNILSWIRLQLDAYLRAAVSNWFAPFLYKYP